MESSLIITIINFLYYVYPLKEEVCAPVDRDKFTKRLYEIWHLLTLFRPGYIFENKMADDRKRIAVNILAFACARIPTSPPPLPPSLRVVSPSQDEFATSCKRSAEFYKEISEKLNRFRVTRGSQDHINGALLIESFSVLWNRILWECSVFACLVNFVYFRGIYFGCNFLVFSII